MNGMGAGLNVCNVPSQAKFVHLKTPMISLSGAFIVKE
jgi:hypothetical protein